MERGRADIAPEERRFALIEREASRSYAANYIIISYTWIIVQYNVSRESLISRNKLIDHSDDGISCYIKCTRKIAAASGLLQDYTRCKRRSLELRGWRCSLFFKNATPLSDPFLLLFSLFSSLLDITKKRGISTSTLARGDTCHKMLIKSSS